MDSTAITDYNYSNCSTDYESLLNNCSSSTSTSPSPYGANERQTEKRPKSNTVMNKIRRFARSQSQVRHGSRGHDYINSDNLVSKTKDLYRDVKRRFSSFNTNSLESSNDGRSTIKSSIPTTRTSNNLKSSCESHTTSTNINNKSTLICDTLHSSAVSRLRRYASDESLPTSESGCGSSVKTSSLSTDSNRSSICTVNDFANEYSVFKGPFIGQGVALTDCTPCPYDKDALVFKKGDLVNIIAKNDSGTWIGMANGKIGHFKFINVEEISSLGNGMRSTCSSFCSASSTTLTSTNGVIDAGGVDESDISNTHLLISDNLSSCLNNCNNTGSTTSSVFTNLNSCNNNNNNYNCSISTSNQSGFVVSHYEDIIRNLLSSVNIYLDNSLKGLFKLIGLDNYDYLTKLKDKGFSSLGSLMNITDSTVLEIVGITCPEHQQTILSIAAIVRKLAQTIPNDSMMIKSSGGNNSSSSSSSFGQNNTNKSSAVTINKLESSFSNLSVNGHSNDLDHLNTQSVPTTPAFESVQKSLCTNSASSTTKTTSSSSSSSSYVQTKQQSSSSQDTVNCSESTIPTTCNITLKSGSSKNDSKNSFATTISVSTSSSSATASTGGDNLINNSNHPLRLRKKRDRRSSETCDNIKRAASGNDILDDDLYLKYKYSSYDHRKSLDTNALVKKLEHGYETTSRTVRGYGDIGPSKMLSSSKSVFDLKFNSDSTSNLIDNESSFHGSIHCTKKRLKKFLNPSDQQQQHRKTISSTITTQPTTTTTTSTTSITTCSSSFDQSQSDSGRLGINSRPLSSALFEALSNILSDENIDLTVEPYSDNSGFCGIPPALVQRYAEELETDVYDIAETLDYIRLCSLLNKAGRQGIPNDFLADSCNGPGTDWANYENLHTWLLSLGLPMYEVKLKDNGHQNLWDIISLREDDLLNCGIINKRHLRSLTTAISALSVNQHKIGRS